MICPALVSATTDSELKGTPREVLFYLHTIMDIGEDRHVKAWVIAQQISSRRRSVTRALQILVERGYIREGKRGQGNVGSYRLVATLERPATPRKDAA